MCFWATPRRTRKASADVAGGEHTDPGVAWRMRSKSWKSTTCTVWRFLWLAAICARTIASTPKVAVASASTLKADEESFKYELGLTSSIMPLTTRENGAF